ncbi:flagellar basal-body MS-ring/collar protein FliF [Comamonas kerstersii]|uniref:Flagellar M-ring protein n=1 Tax=Comamonas kerstersii TaxID=225992 RepID=A0A0W7Z4V1_9BURK|nr:flagellar basal-body MS-ring/collar protein FliF [Comamonas kerstersii]AQZ97591.1 flagellar M-ring protein FliF [Comamonas kerstersii]KAB0584163.1 flagellar basal body M-ring protein FliF [Comamonas kerstersii]KUF42477.1 flagellar M-ring protein FliF [Comamonas kerstersii]OOH88772.1 flagellar M-ring protein FliF [Comamonas kerstersii]OOH95020.1 flagellar M-ring protein FliF [Comamonas kerstersii]
MSAVAEIPVEPNAAPAATTVSWREKVAALDRNQRIMIGAVGALVVAGLVAALMFSRQPDYRVLFSNLSDKDGGAIVAQLASMNVPYKYTEGGGAIMIPADRIHDVRLKLATQGLPKGAVSGFEIMENSKFGITQFQERVNYQRALEGELTRSIMGLSAVQNARVHLALPNQNGFFREQQKPSASVLLTLYPGRMLDRTQIAGIVHLIASSVPEMLPSAVSVLDDSGKLLSQAPNPDESPVDIQQLMYQQQLEKQYTQRILDILEPVVGKGNVKAQVTAELDFSRSESTSEIHAPNQGQAPSAVRSQQVLEAIGEKEPVPPTGVPGAVSNQPPQTAAAPVNGAAPVLQAANAENSNILTIPGSKRESVTNYEVDKTIKVTRSSTGTIKRMTAAVVVNYLPGATAEGTVVPQALTEAQQAQMLALVRETIGYNAERGDSVNLMNAQFQQDTGRLASDLPLWQQPETIALAKSVMWPVGLVLAALILALGVVRPILKARKKKEQAQLDLLAADEIERPALAAPLKPGEPTPEELRLQQARALAKQNPIAVANIVKTWVNGEAN